ncbi:hypothetical protein SAMN04487777_11745 [Priestia aryabhattai B8W22]|nr:hypothetical protein SAMN04487777_11745 [Priestia aryabhattai B8W22]
MNCALCKKELSHISITCFDAINGGHFNICFECANKYFKRYPTKTKNEIALLISLDVEQK